MLAVNYLCKGSKFQANHNIIMLLYCGTKLLITYAKVVNFKQITTRKGFSTADDMLLITYAKVVNFKQITTVRNFFIDL